MYGETPPIAVCAPVNCVPAAPSPKAPVPPAVVNSCPAAPKVPAAPVNPVPAAVIYGDTPPNVCCAPAKS